MIESNVANVTVSSPYAIRNDGIVRENPRKWSLTESSIPVFSRSPTAKFQGCIYKLLFSHLKIVS